MSRSELRAQQLFNAFNLRNEDEEVRRNLIILMLSIPYIKKDSDSSTKKSIDRWQGKDKEQILMDSFGAWGDDEALCSTKDLCADVKKMINGDDFLNKYL